MEFDGAEFDGVEEAWNSTAFRSTAFNGFVRRLLLRPTGSRLAFDGASLDTALRSIAFDGSASSALRSSGSGNRRLCRRWVAFNGALLGVSLSPTAQRLIAAHSTAFKPPRSKHVWRHMTAPGGTLFKFNATSTCQHTCVSSSSLRPPRYRGALYKNVLRRFTVNR